jgi:hypothetical protein
MRRTRIVPFVLGLTLIGFSSSAEPPAAPRTPIEESVTVREVLRPVILEPITRLGGDEATCSSLGPSGIVVTEDGFPAVVTSLDVRPLPRLHAVVLDLSLSMETRIAAAKEAALEYVRSLPPGEQVLVATFSDSLVLALPPTSDREAAAAAIGRASLQSGTALWDSLEQLLVWLDPVPRLKVMVLLTDGHDSTSLRERGFERVASLAETARNLVLFVIGIDLPSRVALGAPLPKVRVDRIARSTGGLFFDLRGTSGLARTFGEIQDRLARIHHVGYLPVRFGETSRDSLDGADGRWRRVAVRAAEGVPCRVVDAGPPRRYEARTPAASPAEEILELAAPGIPVAPIEGPCAPAVGAWRPVAAYRMPAPDLRQNMPATPSWLLSGEPSDLILGRALDIMQERGLLYDERTLRRFGRWRANVDRVPAFEERGFAIEVPELEDLLGAHAGAAGALLRLITSRPCILEEDPAGEEARMAFLIHGLRFLELRPLFGRALFRHRPDYARWAVQRLRQDLEPEGERLIGSLERQGAISVQEASKLRETLLERASDPEPGQTQRLLADWLGDTPARELALELERQTMSALLDNRAGADLLADRVERAWARLPAWFPPSTRVRILALLVAAHDPDQDRIGFYRVLLPRPVRFGPPQDQIPANPWRLRTLRGLLALPAVAGVLRNDFRLGVGGESRSEAGSVGFLDLVPQEGGSPVRVAARFGPDAALECVRLDPPRAPDSSASRRLLLAMTDAGIACASPP